MSAAPGRGDTVSGRRAGHGSDEKPSRPICSLSADTSPEAARFQVELWRRMSPLEKARAVSAVSRAAQELSLAGIRQRHPRAPERECLLRLAVLKLGPALARRVYPEVAALLGDQDR